MTGLSIATSTIEGFKSHSVTTGPLELSIIPELGGKVSSLKDLRTGREWLWKHPRLSYKKVPHGSSYVRQADTGGWDECFPSVAECRYPSAPWLGAEIQDHGELWSQTPDFELDEKEDQVTLRSRWQGIVLPYTFTRTIKLAANSSRLHADYEVLNNSDQPISFVWCIHPLLAIEPGMELLLPPSAQFNVGGVFPQNLLPIAEKLKYPFDVSGLKLPSLPERSAGIAIKLWSDPLPSDEGWAALRASDGEFRMNWDVTDLPQVAAWMNLSGFAADGGTPYFNLGLEPCIGAQDSLNDAVNLYNLFETLQPHDSKSWWLDIELTS